MIHSRVKSHHYQYIVETVTKRMGGWQRKLLSQATILLLIQTVSNTIPAYAMNSCKLPGKLVEELERVNCRFLWGDRPQQRSMHTIAWHVICQPKHRGGLNIRLTADINKILLSKLAWRLINSPRALWSQVITLKYGPLPDLWKREKVASKSVVGRGICLGLPIVMQDVRQDYHGRIAAPPWWNPSSQGQFTTKSAYELLMQAIPQLEPFPWEIIWRFQGPSRGSLLLWQITHDRLKTTSLLFDRHVMNDPSCLICGAVLEDTLHAIRDCRLPR